MSRTQEKLLYLDKEELVSIPTNQDYMVKELRRVMINFAMDSVWFGVIALQSLWKQNHSAVTIFVLTLVSEKQLP